MVRLESYTLNVALLAACIISAAAGSLAGPPAGPVGERGPIVVDTTFSSTFSPGIPAVTYDPVAVPETGKIRVVVLREGEASLAVTGLAPDRFFGAHLNTGECGPSAVDVGPHYQHIVSPDPLFANPENEVWLDFTTDNQGLASSSSVHAWPFDPARPPRSIIIDDGKPAARLACVNVPWR
jgi:Cu-Zn family superoxide dismutase